MTLKFTIEMDEYEDMTFLAEGFKDCPEAFGNLLCEMAGRGLDDPKWQDKVAMIASSQFETVTPALRSIAYRTQKEAA